MDKLGETGVRLIIATNRIENSIKDLALALTPTI